MECLCAAKISVNFGMCFNGTIRRPWVWNFIGVALKATSFGKVDFINTFLMDFGLLLYISEYSGKTMEECYVNNGGVQCNGNRDGKNSDVVSDNDYSSDSKTQLHLNCQKKIYQLLKIIVLSQCAFGACCTFMLLEHVFQKCTKLWQFLCLSGNL